MNRIILYESKVLKVFTVIRTVFMLHDVIKQTSMYCYAEKKIVFLTFLQHHYNNENHNHQE